VYIILLELEINDSSQSNDLLLLHHRQELELIVKRRVFINTTVFPVFMAGLAGVNSMSLTAGEGSKGKRSRLPEAGPMIPPVPAILLTVNGKPGDPEEISVVWTFILEGQPPQVGISVADAHVAGDLIKLHKEFVLNVPTADIITAFDTVDMNSSKVGDKFTLSGLTRGQAVEVDAPTVAEAAIQVECRVFNTIVAPPHRTVFFADVLATTVLDGVVDENGRLIVPNVSFFGMTAGSGEFYTMGQPVGFIGKSVGRTDIKY
jgi:flavin reductase (DIM6/NTAB) family NADH-FMN oxidoreductase RutF